MICNAFCRNWRANCGLAAASPRSAAKPTASAPPKSARPTPASRLQPTPSVSLSLSLSFPLSPEYCSSRCDRRRDARLNPSASFFFRFFFPDPEPFPATPVPVLPSAPLDSTPPFCLFPCAALPFLPRCRFLPFDSPSFPASAGASHLVPSATVCTPTFKNH